MNDKELLELAARAAGITILRWGMERGAFVDDGRSWSPLHDDGDALRLALKLKMNVCLHAAQDVMTNACYRRAIVRAAAEIGRNM